MWKNAKTAPFQMLVSALSECWLKDMIVFQGKHMVTADAALNFPYFPYFTTKNFSFNLFTL